MTSSRNKIGLILGVILIGAGVIFLVGQIMGLTSIDLLWPFVIVAVGLAFFIGMLIGGPETGALAIPGSIIVTIGLIIFLQNALDTWETWSYAWALIIVAVGVGLWIDGAYSQQSNLRTTGIKVINTGLILFVVFGLIISLVFNLTNQGGGSFSFWGLLLALLGLYLLVWRSARLVLGRAEWDDRDLFWPVIMIGAGLVLFLYGLGQLPVDQLASLWKWWPLALILLGLDWLVGKRWPLVGGILATLIVVLVLILMFDPVALGRLNP